MNQHAIVSREEWIAARKDLLRREKEYTRERDRLAAARRALPWVRIDKPYVFQTPGGEKTLAELFDGRSQLIVYHFMLGPDWKEGCVGCSFVADHVDGAEQHLRHHDVTFTSVSRAPLPEIEAYKKRMGWKFPWVSSFGSDFNYDFNVSFSKEQLSAGKVFYNFRMTDGHEELHGISVFRKDETGQVFHTYSSYARGLEEVLGTYMFLDITPKGRDEVSTMDWVKRHDQYEEKADGCCHAA
jgi:predicted dithiol-disulfide oxidoreductase (DUF899 family)